VEDAVALDTYDVRLLRIFVTIVEAGGFAAAQSELNLSLSTISSHIAALETRLSLTLCRRGRAGFKLTDEGRAVYDEVKRLFGTIEQFDARMRGLKHHLTGTLSIGLTDNTLTDPNSKLNAVLRRFADEAPDVALSIVTRPPHELLRDVISGQLHLAIASFPRVTLGLEYADLYVETNSFYCGREHPLFDVPEADISIDTVRNYNLIGRYYWNSRDLKIFAIANPKATVSDMEAEARLILSGRYLGYLPDHFAARYIDEGQLRCVRPDLFRYKAKFQVAYDRGQARSGPKPFFLNILAEEYGGGAKSRRPKPLSARTGS
jgi:LysR family transcriptional regulator, transcriptional activator for bauABCD operon